MHCVNPVFFALLFFHLSKAFPCGLDPTSRLTACRCRQRMGPPGTSHCVLNCIFNEKNVHKTTFVPTCPCQPQPLLVLTTNIFPEHQGQGDKPGNTKWRYKSPHFSLWPSKMGAAAGIYLQHSGFVHESSFAGRCSRLCWVSVLPEHTCLSTGWLVMQGHLQLSHHQWSTLCQLSVVGAGGDVLEIAICETLEEGERFSAGFPMDHFF